MFGRRKKSKILGELEKKERHIDNFLQRIEEEKKKAEEQSQAFLEITDEAMKAIVSAKDSEEREKILKYYQNKLSELNSESSKEM